MIVPGTLGVYMFARNLNFYDYPWKEALMSALPIADEIVVCECYSDKDETLKELEAFAEGHSHVKIVQHDWVDHYNDLSILGNFCVPFLNTEWAWQLQADEVIHESSYDEIRECVRLAKKETTAFKVKYTHLMANYETEFDFMYQELVRISKRGTGWWLLGDACQLGGGDPRTVEDTAIRVFHYGKVHAGAVGWQKEWDFQQLFKDVGFPDPKMMEMKERLGEQFCDYLYLFEDAIKKGQVRKFAGTHPLVLQERIAKSHLDGWEQFTSRIKQELTLK